MTPLTFHRTPPVGTPVGISAWHRQWVKGQIAGEASVPCGGCAAPCCTSMEHVTLDPHIDDVSQYATRRLPTGPTVLQQQADGSCIYFVDGQCSIHARRPSVCRLFDCRMYNLLLPDLDVLGWPHDPARAVAELLRDTANARFPLIEKEPDDWTFDQRFWTLYPVVVGRWGLLDLSSLLSLTLLAMRERSVGSTDRPARDCRIGDSPGADGE